MNAPSGLIRTSFLTLVSVLLLTSPTLAAILEPIGLQDGQLLPKNQAEFHIGFSYADGMRNLFQSEDRDRRVMEIPTLTLNLGLAERVEAQIQYSYLHLRENGQGGKFGSGDVTLGLKVRLWQESLRLPAIALRLATKLPNADDEDDFGTDEADIFIDALFTRNYPLFTLYVNAGVAILGDPRSGNDGQDDMFRYGVGVKIPVLEDQLAALVSVEGMEGDESVNSRGAFRAGIQAELGRFTWDLGGSVGYVDKSEDWSVRTGLTTYFELPAGW
ncbi:hypothetical protein Pcar_2697 [Syntrophotalea carbinolica DSM 2380]|uniref:Transporter n=1 Tax=Syntrophotalea carbinolica (strain DSM 2380 / NBRC 103641 / GraBd1) TaxID=338963 RepID=Q3A124_SYNC1|nr:hypothetical protein [Syntrophotalea carbinolica]ABA89933.1 hypothetical protein Pcar_2697 [Syntrophotalea carbinolica DSM 2380]